MTNKEYDVIWSEIEKSANSFRIYRLQISASKDKYSKINKILGIKPNVPYDLGWNLEYVEKEEDEYIPFVKNFISILEGKFDKLKEIGIERNDISIWYLYAYNAQCNIEFEPENLLLLGQEGIVFCISCFDIHDYEADKYDENGKLILNEQKQGITNAKTKWA